MQHLNGTWCDNIYKELLEVFIATHSALHSLQTIVSWAIAAIYRCCLCRAYMYDMIVQLSCNLK